MSISLWCPFPSEINPLANKANTQTARWANTLQLVKTDKEVERLLRSKVGNLVSRGFPKAPEEHLQLIADWTTYFCLLDDHIDAPGLHPLAIGAYLSSLSAAFEEGASLKSEPLTIALLDLQRRMRAMCSPSWMTSFTAHLKELFTAFSWESFYRFYKTTPDTETYLQLRQVTVGIQMELLFCDLSNPQPLTEKARMACNLIGWQNDIFTYEKELEQGETLNLIIVLMRTEKLSKKEAEARAITMHNAEVERLLQEPHDPSEALQHWIRGHIEWANETGRYRPSYATKEHQPTAP